MTAKPRLLVTRQFPDAVMDRISVSYDAIVNQDDHPLSADEILSLAGKADAIMCASTERFDKALIEALPDTIKMIATYSVGYDHLDVAAAKSKGITLSNTPDVLTDATADIAFLCLLGAARQAQSSAATLRSGQWDRWTPTQFLGVHVTGKKLGILGMGRIGQAVARRAKGFDMEIHYHNRRPVAAPGLEDAIYHSDKTEFLKQCEFLSINCPLSPETKYFLNEETLRLLPEGAVVVNTARGPVIKDTALIAALKQGHIAAAGLDVFENEPHLNPDYLALDNVFVLPHIGSATTETRNLMGFVCLDNLDAFFAGKPLPSPIG
ncbi:2-hydroxyacid dehydrogenase [Sneathiella chinensis]|uniref:D-glycerate dehydrogenase n=1 Tax=Sneathiella chinensis TaxID=349750 RepID=A0ABQ5U286_9PROT|nr:D-glycerate dehydrogenase [Sneathiella chinensis]GLQ05780.1 D-glycerate dehydrogenase [Sneathiella chinensis]